MTAAEYIELVTRSADPFEHNVADPEFQLLTTEDQELVIQALDGYGLRDLVERQRSKPVDFGNHRFYPNPGSKKP